MSLYLLTNRVFENGAPTDRTEPYGNSRLFRHEDRNAFSLTPQTDTDEYLALKRFQEISAGMVKEAMVGMAAEAKQLTPGHPIILAQIHGYNTSLAEALQGAAVTLQELSNRGVRVVMVCYSWPSDDNILGYPSDFRDAYNSHEAVIRALNLARTEFDLVQCDVNLVVLAHSMGNRVMREAMAKFAPAFHYPRHCPIFSETICVAADIDHDSFAKGGSAQAWTDFSRRVTVYFNRHDQVLLASTTVKNGGSQRLGRNGPKSFDTLDPKVVPVDCSPAIHPAGEGLQGYWEGVTKMHNAYFTSPAFYDDLAQTIMGIDRQMITTRQLGQPMKLKPKG